MERKKYFLRVFALLALLLPWTLQAQNAKVSEYDYHVSSATYTSIASTGTAWTSADLTAGYVDVTVPFAMYLGENQAPANSTISVYPDGHVVLNGLTDAEIAPLKYSSGYSATATSIYYQTSATEVTVEWRKVVAAGNALSFQLKLRPDGDILFCYGPMGITASISVYAGIQADGYIFRVGGNNWSDITRYTSDNSATRTLSSNNHPDYDVNTGVGTVYTFTQPACVKPTAITATATSWNTVQVGWTVAEPGVKYQVAYSTEADFDADAANFPASQIVTVNDGTATSTEINNLSSSTTYYFAVRKYCDANTPSGWLYKTTGTTTPESCPSPALSNFSLSSAGVASWNGLATSYPNITSVDIYYSTTIGTPDANVTPQFENVPVSTASVDLMTQNLEALTTYYVYFRAHCTIDGGNTTNWVGSRSFTTPCATETFPFYENFDNWSSKSTCWSFLSGSYSTTPSATTSSSAWTLNTSYGSYITISGKALTMNIYSTNRFWAVTPNIAITSDNAQVSVDVAVARWSAADPNYDDNDSFVIAVSNDNGNTYTTLLQYSNTELNALSNNYTTLTVPLVGYNGQSVRIAFYGGSEASGGDNRIAIDNIAVEVPPTCFQPTIASVTSDGLVSWTAVNGTASYELICVPAGTDKSEGTIVNAGTGTSYQLTGLESATTYDVYLRSYCSADDQSRWSTPYTFVTACVPTTLTIGTPYIYGFENATGSGSANTIDVCWHKGTNYSTAYPYPYSSYVGSNPNPITPTNNYCLYMYGTTTYYSYAALPEFTNNVSDLQISLKVYRSSTSTYYGRVQIGVMTDVTDISTFTMIQEVQPSATSTWEKFEIPLDSYTGANGRIAIRTTPGGTCYAYIDDIEVSVLPSCRKPGSLIASAVTSTTATLNWNANGAAQYEVEYGPAGFAHGEGRTVVVNTNSANLDYLYMVTNYEAYVRSLCTGEDPSQWSNVCEFKTVCPNGGDVTIGNGTYTGQYVPVHYNWGNTYSQQIFTAQELTDAGLTAGEIQGISYSWYYRNSYTKEFSIYIGTTDKSEFSSNTDWVTVTGSPAYGPAPFATANAQEDFVFTTPFIWDGTSNIVITTVVNQYNSTGTGASGITAYANNTGYNRSIYKYRDNSPFSIDNIPTASGRTTYRANVKFLVPCDTGACPAPSVAIAGSQSGDYAVAELTFTDNSSEATPTYGYKCGLKGFDPASVTGTTTTNTTASIGNLAGNTEYDLYVYAVCGGTDGNMVRYTFTTPMVYACKPQANFAASNVTYTSATVTWEQVDPNQTPESWTVRFADHQIADMSAAAATEYTESTVMTPTLALTGLHNGNTYYIYTKATCNALDVSPDWTEFSFTTNTVMAPDAIAFSNVTNRTADMSWTDNNTPATNNYTVRYANHQIADIDNAAATEYTEVSLTATQYAFTMSNPLDPAAGYYVYVRANSGDEHSAWSVATVNTLCPAPVEVSMGDADGTTQYMPFYTFYNYSLSEQIYTAEELGGPNTFSTLSYEVTSTTPTRDGCAIYLVETNLSSFSSYADAISTTGLTPVFNGTMDGTVGWHTIEFDTPFAYSGNGNLIVVVDRAYTYYASSGSFGTIATDVPQGIYAYDDNLDITPENIGSANYKEVLNQKNNFKFGGCDATVTCIPPKDVTAQVSTTNEVTLTWATREGIVPVPTTFEVRYDVAGTDADECANVITDITALNATFSNGLVKNTDYVVYVASKCGANDYSPWQKATFTTNPTCWDPSNLAAETALTTPSSVTLTWNNNATVPASRWQIAYAEGHITDPEAATNIVDATTTEGTEITGLKHSTIYTFYVRAVCDETGEDVSNWIGPLHTATGCAAWTADDLPMTEDFSNVSGMPLCWSKMPATGTYPHSNNGYLWFYNNSTTDLYAVLPEVSVDVNTLDVAFDLYFDMEDNLIVGVMSDPADASTFTPVVTLNSNDYNYSEYNNVTAQLADYTGTGHYVAFKVAGTNSDAYIYVDNLTLKVREASHPLADNGETVALCDQYLIPTISDQTNTYSPNLNATYIITPAEAGKVLKIKGDYNLEYGYDFLDVYEGTGANATLVETLTGKGNYEYMTSSYDWANMGGIKLVFRTDEDNALPNLNGFHFLATCECPMKVNEVEELTAEANGTYTWTAPNGDGHTYTHNVVLTGLTYGNTEETVDDIVNTYNYTQTNVAGCDSIDKALTLTLHPTYHKTYDAEICQYETFDFYGQQYTTTGTYTVNLLSKDGADSTGVLNLQVHTAPTVAINYNGRAVTEVSNFCDNADMALVARSNTSGATFVWDDNSTNANRVVNPHENNTYTVIATEPTYGCPSLQASLNVTTTPVPELSISATEATICYGQSTTLTLSDANNTNATYSWSNGQTGNTITVSPTETTTYTATATTTTGACVATAEYTVTVNQLPVVAVQTSVSSICSDSIINLSATAVDGYSYLWSTGATTPATTTVATATSDYSVTVTDANGCVNEFTTAVVTVRPSYERNVTMDVCYTQNPYTWGAQQLTADGSYDQMFTAANGCDSLIHLDFTFQQMSVFNTPREVCEGTVLTWGPETVTATENTTVSYILNAGDIDPDNNVLECPAQYNLNLTVNHPAASSFERTVCDSTTWNVSGLTYYESGAYPFTLATTKGCDSVVTMNLTVNYHVFTEETVEHACDSYTWNTETYTEAGDYVQNFTGYQCDSTRTLHLLVVDNTTYGTDNILYCGNPDSWIAGNTAYTWIDGETYTMSEIEGNITHNLQGANENGCDSIVTLNLTLNPVAEVMNWTNVTACDEYSIDTISCDGVRGTKYINQSGDYQLRTPTATEGRDVLTQIHLTVNRSSYHTNVVTACVPYNWYVVIGQDEETGEDINYLVGTYNESDNISFQMPDQYSTNGCNRIEVLRLTALQPTEEVTEAAICQNGSWTAPDNSITYNGADLEIGENTKIWNRTTNEAGCNLDKKVVLTVNPIYAETAELTFCESEFTNNQLSVANALNSEDTPVVLTIEGALNQTPYTNTVTANWTTQNGCDSVVTITYTVNPTTYQTVDYATCYRYTWDANGETYEESGSYTYTDVNANSYHCDNVITLNLTINDSVVDNETEYHCSEYEYEGVTYRETRTFREELEPTADGCEHIRYITHAVVPTQMTDLYVVTNMPYTWQNGVTYTESIENVYFETTTLAYAATNGSGSTQCDSILNLHLTIIDDTAMICENELPYIYSTLGVTLDGSQSSMSTWTGVKDLNLMNNTAYYFYGTDNIGQWTQWRSRLFPGDHDGMLTVNGTEVANRESEYITVDLVVNGETKATKTLHNLNPFSWIDVFFDTPVRINDNDTVDFIYTTESQYAMYTIANDNNIQHPESFQTRYCPTCEWNEIGELNGLYFNLNQWYNFGIDEGYYYTSNDAETHHDTILYYVVNENRTNTVNVTACDSYTWEANGQTYTESGVYTFQTTTAAGCDSTVILNLTINTNSSDTLDAVVACDNYEWVFNGVTVGNYTESGYQTYQYFDANNCASVATLPLTINNSQNITLDAVNACDSYEWVYNGITIDTYTEGGDKVYNTTDATTGCAINVTLPLTINASSERDETFVVNAASTYRNGNYYPASDTPYSYDSISVNAAGCPETIHVTLIVHQGATEDVEVNACGEYTWETANNGNNHTYAWIPTAERQANGMALYKDITDPNNTVYIHSGENPTFATYNNDGTVNTTYILWLNLSEAGYQTVDLGNILLSQQASLTVNGGADSLDAQTIDLSEFIAAKQNATLNVQVRHNSPSNWYCGNIVTYTANLLWNYDTVEATVCAADNYTWTDANATFAVTTGNDNWYTHTFNAGTANEQVTTMHVTVTPRTNSEPQQVSNCFTYTWNNGDGQTYTTSGIHTWNDDVNCTLETLDLTIFDNSSFTLPAVEVCDSYTWSYGGTEIGTYTNTGNYTYDITDANGCAAVVTLPLTINVNHGNSNTVTVCDTYTWNANDGNSYVLTESQTKIVSYTDANGCEGNDSIILNVNNRSTYTDVQTACESFDWIVNDVTVGTYTESNNTASYTITGGNAAGCDSVVNLDLTVYHPRTFARDQYAYGNGITINGHFYEAPTTGVATYNVVLDTVDPEANNCATVVNVTLYVSQYEYFYTNYVACGSYTWDVNNHTYRALTDEELAANPTAQYFDVTDNVAVVSNPMATNGNRIDVLNLTINRPSETNISRTVLMSQLEAGHTLTLEGNVEDFSTEYAAHQTTTVTRSYSLGAHATCDSIVNYTINLVWNYDTVNATVCDVTSYTWTEADETFAVVTGDNLYTHVFNAGTETEQVTTMKVTVNARTEAPQDPVTVCDSYTWHGTEYTASANLEYNDDENCTHETLVLTINTNAGSEQTVAECFTYTWNVPTYELDATNNTYVAADDISNTYTEGGVKTVQFIDANGCEGTATLNLTIYADSSETLAAVTACDSYEWIYNNNTIDTYTEGGDKTYNWTDVNGCPATATLPLTINNSASVNVEFWEGEGSYRYTGFYSDATPQMLNAQAAPYNFVETVAGATAEGCDSIYNITLHVGNYYYATETYRSCNTFTWERNNHTYIRLTDEQAAANPTALYYDETDQAMVIYNPTANVANEGDYDSVFMLQLTLDAVWDSVAVVNFPVSEGIFSFKGRTYDYTMTNDEGRLFNGATEVDTIHFAAQTFCDSIYYLTLNVYNNYREAETADICATTTEHTWRGQTINTTTNDYDTIHTYYMYDAINDNDSVEYLVITQHPVTYATERREACGSYTWDLNGETYTTSTSNETYVSQDEFGCDHIVTLTLTINPVYDLVENTTACDTYTWEGQTYTESTVDTRSYTTAEGCDSIMTLNLTINNNSNSVVVADECDTYTWTTTDGTELTYTTSGSYEYLYNTAEGCPSVDSLYLTIRNNSNQSINKVVCDTYTWTAADGGNGETYTATGVYNYDYTAENGCPSTNTLNLTVNNNAGSTEEATACDTYTWNAPDGETYTLNETQVKTITFTDANGCEGEATLNLTINVNEGSVENVAECQSYTWAVNGQTYTTSGIYTQSVTDANGCEGTDSLILTIGTMRTFVNQQVTNCGAFTWIVNDSTLAVFEQSTEASANLPNSITGCDSVIMLSLTVLNAPVVNEGETVICESALPLTWQGTEYNEGGELTKNWAMDNGCDSVRTMTLTVTPTIHTALTDNICLGNDYNANGFNIAASEITAAGEYTFTRTETNANTGCDEEFTLTLTVGDVLANNVDPVTACDSYTWTAGDGQTYELDSTGTYQSQPYANALGCTTVDVLALTVLTNGGSEETQVACDSYTWNVNGETYTTSGDYTATISDGNGCNGTATLHLTIGNSEVSNITVAACDTYTWTDGDGETYTNSGVYTYNYTNSDNCNGTKNLILTINNNSSTAFSATACDTYTWNEQEYNATGVYTFAYNDANNCPSVDTLTLTINNSTTSEESAVNCSYYNWHGETYTTSGDYNYVSTNTNGCPDTVTLHLTINNPVTVTIDTTVCDNFMWNNIRYENSDVITHSFTAANGCDSIEVINLTVNEGSVSTAIATACDSYTWPTNGQTYTIGGTMTAIIEGGATNGCDSTVTLVLTINHNSNSSETAEACDTYTWNGQTYTTSGVKTYEYTSNEGCPSVDTLNLTINNSTTGTENVEVCNNYIWNGTTYNQSGAYNQTLTAANGCDSVVTLNLTISPAVTTNVIATACGSYDWNGYTYTTSGNYTYTTVSANGCDSIVTLVLTISEPVTSTAIASACDSYTWNGTTYTTSGSYLHTYTAANGCDSIVTLVLTINQPKTTTLVASACDSYTWNGTTYTTGGNYTSNYTAANGCDSIVTLNLTINHATTGTVSVTACDSYTWMNGQTYTASTSTPTVTLTNAAGCDSVVTLNLTINNSVNSSETVTACDSYTWHGNNYTTSGTYNYTTTAANGCDSIVTLNLTINQPKTSTLAVTACDSYTWEGNSYTATGEYTHTYTAANGCDSVVTLLLTVNNSVSTVDEQTACDGYIWIDNINYTESTTTPTVTLRTSEGCDSVVTLHLTINNSVEIYDTIDILSTQLPYNYHGNTIPDAGDYVFNGTTVNGCDSSVYLHVNVTIVGINTVSNLDDVTVYPNPTHGRATITADDVVKVDVYDIVGRLVATFEKTNQIDLSNLAQGSYTLRITLPDGTAVRKVVKK
jgi:hypothetical protein